MPSATSSPSTTTTTTITTPNPSSSPKRKRTSVPILLESFPSPPSFIPPTPTVSSNPPPSLPPSLPLPPVPGPSPISHQDTLLFLSNARPSTNPRPSPSSPTSDSRRNSTVTIASLRSVAHTPRLPGFQNKRESIASLRSVRSNFYHFPAVPQIPNSVVFLESAQYPIISEEDATDAVALARSSAVAPLPLADVDEDAIEKILELAPSSTLPLTRSPYVPSHSADESISSIDMRDLPALQDDDDSALEPPPKPLPVIQRPRLAIPPSPSTHLPPEDTARSLSPDINHILSSTPRPRKSSSRQQSESRLRKLSGLRKPSGELLTPYTSHANDACSPLSIDDQDWRDDSFVSDYGVPIHRESGAYEFDEIDPEVEARLERQLEGVESDSDSSLDLHTPLPTLMLRHGHLSPHSKLLPQRSEPQLDTRPGSIFSVTSTKSSAFKDHRDTPKRRNRHRDQRLLRGGIGLTTGLGWSDSEDEDAPSALTRRISSLNLSRQTSMSSVHSIAHPKRSLSISTLAEDEADLDRSTSRSTRTPKGRSSLPPTSWQKRNVGGRLSSSSTSSMLSLSLSFPEQQTSRPASRIDPSIRVNDVPEMSRASSTASSVSIQFPVTPKDNEDAQSPKMLDMGKSLPPLPSPSLVQSKLAGAPQTFVARSRAASVTSSTARETSNSSSISQPSSRIASQMGSPRPLQLTTSKSFMGSNQRPGMKDGSSQLTPPAMFSRAPGERKRLRAMTAPRYSDSSLQPPVVSASRSTPLPGDSASTTATTPATPTVTTPETNAAPTASGSSPTTAGAGEAPLPAKPRPRIGTGMPYRTASHSSLGTQSRMRMPGTGYGAGASGLPRLPVAAPRGVAF